LKFLIMSRSILIWNPFPLRQVAVIWKNISRSRSAHRSRITRPADLGVSWSLPDPEFSMSSKPQPPESWCFVLQVIGVGGELVETYHLLPGAVDWGFLSVATDASLVMKAS
jgi:hypothetical protein